MVDDMTFYFRIEKEAGFAEDEEGNPAEYYISYRFKFETPVDEKEVEETEKKIMDRMRIETAKLLKTEPKYLTPISEQEYRDNTD